MRSEKGCLERVLQTATRFLFLALPLFAAKSAPALEIYG
jgi:hypothetical protein